MRLLPRWHVYHPAERKKLPTPTHGGLSLYLKGEPNQKTTETTSIEARAVEIEKYPRTRYSRCWLFCIMYICTSDEPAHVHLFSSSFPYYPPLKLVVTPQIRSRRIKEKNHVVAVADLRSRGRIDVQVGKIPITGE